MKSRLWFSSVDSDNSSCSAGEVSVFRRRTQDILHGVVASLDILAVSSHYLSVPFTAHRRHITTSCSPLFYSAYTVHVLLIFVPFIAPNQTLTAPQTDDSWSMQASESTRCSALGFRQSLPHVCVAALVIMQLVAYAYEYAIPRCRPRCKYWLPVRTLRRR